jgi:WD40 repeat protein
LCLVASVLADEPTEMRVWRDLTGHFAIRAMFLGMEYSRDARDTVVRLRTEDGREIAVPAKKLCDADRSLLQRLAEARRPQPAARPTAEPADDVEQKPLEVRGAKEEPATPRNTSPNGFVLPLEPGSRPVKSPELLGHERTVCAIAFTPDGKQMLTAANNCEALVWDFAAGKPIRRYWIQYSGSGSNEFAWMTLAAGGRRLFLCSQAEISLWDFATGEHLGGIYSKRFFVSASGVRLDGQQVVAIDRTNLYQWDIPSGTIVERSVPSASVGGRVVYSPDGQQMIYQAHGSVEAVLLDGQTAEHLATLETPLSVIDAIAFTPDSKGIATSGTKGIHFWASADGEQLKYLGRKHVNRTPGLVFHPDGSKLVSVSHDRLAIVWDAHNGKLLHEFTPYLNDHLTAVAYTPDTKALVIGTRWGKVGVWDAETFELIRQISPGNTTIGQKPSQ